MSLATQVMFWWFVTTGTIHLNGDVDGRPMYELYDHESCELISEYAYKGEILNYLETGSFIYDEDMVDYKMVTDTIPKVTDCDRD